MKNLVFQFERQSILGSFNIISSLGWEKYLRVMDILSHIIKVNIITPINYITFHAV